MIKLPWTVKNILLYVTIKYSPELLAIKIKAKILKKRWYKYQIILYLKLAPLIGLILQQMKSENRVIYRVEYHVFIY